YFGGVFATIEARSDAGFRQLISRFIDFYADNLLNPHWGEIVTLRPGNRLNVRMAFQGLDQQQAEAIWRPFLQWVTGSPQDYTFRSRPRIVALPARSLWDPAYLNANFPGAVLPDDRPGASEDNVFWSANLAEAGHFIFGFHSLWLPSSL